MKYNSSKYLTTIAWDIDHSVTMRHISIVEKFKWICHSLVCVTHGKNNFLMIHKKNKCVSGRKTLIFNLDEMACILLLHSPIKNSRYKIDATLDGMWRCWPNKNVMKNWVADNRPVSVLLGSKFHNLWRCKTAMDCYFMMMSSNGNHWSLVNSPHKG